MATQSAEQFETVIVGGGQAGLAVGYHLARRGRSFVILDAGARVGDVWRRRWDSLRLYSPARFDALPGMPFPASRWSFPSTHEMADYLEEYATQFALPVRTGVTVERLDENDGRFVLQTGVGTYEADNVVVATGVFDKPVVPEFARGLDPRIRQLHSSEYRKVDQLAEGPVLVVGASHSGSDIAFEAANAGHETILSGRDTGQLPASVDTRRGRMIFRTLLLLSRRVLTVDTPLGRKMREKARSHGAPLLRVRRDDLRTAGVERVVARTIGTDNGRPQLEDGRVLDVANVIWCTGFRPDYGWISLPLELGADGYPLQHRGVSTAPGIYFVGLPFLHSFSSMLIAGAGRDADRLVEHLTSRASARDGALMLESAAAPA